MITTSTGASEEKKADCCRQDKSLLWLWTLILFRSIEKSLILLLGKSVLRKICYSIHVSREKLPLGTSFIRAGRAFWEFICRATYKRREVEFRKRRHWNFLQGYLSLVVILPLLHSSVLMWSHIWCFSGLKIWLDSKVQYLISHMSLFIALFLVCNDFRVRSSP